MKKTYLLPVTIIFLAIAALLVVLIVSSNQSPQKYTKEQTEAKLADLKKYTDALHLTNKEQVYNNSTALGCFEDEADKVRTGVGDCTLSSTHIYKLEGSYREHGKEILAFLKEKGFDFRKGDKYKAETEQKLNDTSIADNMSNGEPIMIELYNKEEDARVMFSLGGRDQVIPYPDDPETSRLAPDQLVAMLQFYKP